MALEDKISRYGQNAGVNTSTISGRLEALAKDVKNLVQIQGQLEGTARDVENLVQIQGRLAGTARDVKTGGSPGGRHESSNIEPITSNGLAK